MQVTKRNGSLQELSIPKIQQACDFACEGLEGCDSNKLQLGAQIQFYDGIATVEIQKAMILAAQREISVEKPNYSYAAARLLLQNIYKEAGCKTSEGLQYRSLRDVIEEGVAQGRIDPRLLSFNLEKYDSFVKTERDFEFDLLSLSTLEERYLIRKTGGREIIEMPQHFWMRVTLGLAINEPEQQRDAFVERLYSEYSRRRFISSTPTLFNSGTNFSQMSSCYGNLVEDDLVGQGGIFDKIKECAALSKYAGGIGTDWTRVRAKGSVIESTNGKSSGVVPFLKVFNDTSVAVNQCFSPETLVYTSDGIIPIAEVQPGKHLVLTERGVYREVLEKLDYNQEADMLSLAIKHSIEPVRVTTEHPFYAIKGVPKEQSIGRTLSQLKKGKFKAEWVDAGHLIKGDYVAFPIPQEVVPQNCFDDDTGRMYGIMLGDGHFSVKDGKVREGGVSFHRENDSHIEFVCEYLDKMGVRYWLVNHPSSKLVQVRWTYSGESHVDRCATTGRLLEKEDVISCLPFGYEDLYDSKGNKRIHSRLMHLPLSCAKQIVRGLIESDGCISRGKEITFHNTSQELAEGIRYQLLRCSVVTSGNVRNRHYDHDVVRPDGKLDRITGNSICYDVRIPAVDWLAELFDVPELTRFNWFEHEGCIYSRVVSTEPLSESDRPKVVYDLRVDGIHSYTLTSGLVHNGGKRKGAFAAYLEPWHADAIEFMELKRNSGDERRRTHDIFPAWWLNDLLIKRQKAGEQWSFFDPKDVPHLHELYGEEFEKAYIEAEERGLAVKTIDAHELWRKIVGSLIETGAPWITFKDEHNRRNPQSHCGVIHNTNLCTEISLNNDSDETFVCNLGSLNLAAFVVDGEMDFVALADTVTVAIRALDNVIDLNYYPSEESRKSNLLHRPIGLGVMGYTEALTKCGINYESQAHLAWASKVFDLISFSAIAASCGLAMLKGAYGSFEGSKWSKGILPIHTANTEALALAGGVFDAAKWQMLAELVQKHGMRNSNVMAIAPTATIGNIAGTTACTELAQEPQYKKANLGGSFTVIDPSTLIDPELAKYSYEVDQTWHIKAAAVRQCYIDQAQSLNLFRKGHILGRQVGQWYELAQQLGLKSTYYLKNEKKNAKMKKAGE